METATRSDLRAKFIADRARIRHALLRKRREVVSERGIIPDDLQGCTCLELRNWARANESEKLFRAIVARGFLSLAENLLDHGTSIPMLTLPWAADCGHLKVVQLLINHGASIDSFDPLSYAARNGHVGVVRLLIKHGALLTTAAIMFAATYGHSKVVRLLQEYKKTSRKAHRDV